MDKEDLTTVQLPGEIGFTLICAGPLPRIFRGRIFELRLTESLTPAFQALRRHAVRTSRAAGRQTGLRFAMERFRRASNAAAGKGRNDCGTFKGETAIRRAPTASGHSARDGSQMRAGSAGHSPGRHALRIACLGHGPVGRGGEGQAGCSVRGPFPICGAENACRARSARATTKGLCIPARPVATATEVNHNMRLMELVPHFDCGALPQNNKLRSDPRERRHWEKEGTETRSGWFLRDGNLPCIALLCRSPASRQQL
jgi:hypothetical protein